MILDKYKYCSAGFLTQVFMIYALANSSRPSKAIIVFICWFADFFTWFFLPKKVYKCEYEYVRMWTRPCSNLQIYRPCLWTEANPKSDLYFSRRFYGVEPNLDLEVVRGGISLRYIITVLRRLPSFFLWVLFGSGKIIIDKWIRLEQCFFCPAGPKVGPQCRR